MFQITKTDAVLIGLSALGGFVLVSSATNWLAGLIGGAPSGALGGVLACIIIRFVRGGNRDQPPSFSSSQVRKLILGILVFGVLMAIRTELEQIWVRAFVVACAGGVLGWTLLQARKCKL